MNQNELISALEQIRVLADRALTQGDRPSAQRRRAKAPPEVAPSSGGSLPMLIMQLRDEGFFKNAKTAKEVHDALQERYSCALDRVSMALLRLQRKKKLRKASKLIEGKKQVAYVW